MSTKLKIGITGGQGLIGKALRNNITTPVVFISRQLPDTPIKDNEFCLVGSFTDPEIKKEFIRQADVLIHAATLVGPRSDYEDSYIENDLVGTIELARDFFKFHPNGHLIFLSTAGGLYNLNDPSVKTEESEIFPDNIYGAIKLIVENYLEDLVKNNGRVTILRPAPIYGDSLKKNQTNGLIDKLLRSTLDGPEAIVVNIFDHLKSARDYLHIDDLVRAIILIINSKEYSGFEIYNLGTGTEVSIEEVLEVLNDICPGEIKYKILPVDRKASSLVINSEKIFKKNSWKPRVTLKEGIRKMHLDLKL